MDNRKESSVCFTGYRTSKLLRASKKSNIVENLRPILELTIKELYEQGYTTFLSGMADGFDMLAAEAVLRLRIQHPRLRFIAVIPFMGQELGYSQVDKERYKAIYELADKVVFTSDTYCENAYFIRNDYLIEHSSIVVCFYDGQRGGTMYTYNRAIKNKVEIINLANNGAQDTVY